MNVNVVRFEALAALLESSQAISFDMADRPRKLKYICLKNSYIFYDMTPCIPLKGRQSADYLRR
jgi:hypothetical protein